MGYPNPSPHLFKFCSTLLLSLLSPTPPPLLILLSCFFGWMGITPTLMIDIMNLHMSSLRSLMCVVKFNVVWYIMWFFADTLIWYHTHKHTHKDTQHTQGPVHIPIQTNICTSCYQLSLFHWMKNSVISKIYFPQCLFCSRIIHLQKSYLLIRRYNNTFFLWNTNNTDTNGANKQNTHIHTPNTQRKITLERVS